MEPTEPAAVGCKRAAELSIDARLYDLQTGDVDEGGLPRREV